MQPDTLNNQIWGCEACGENQNACDLIVRGTSLQPNNRDSHIYERMGQLLIDIANDAAAEPLDRWVRARRVTRALFSDLSVADLPRSQEIDSSDLACKWCGQSKVRFVESMIVG
jgi:hypothetical protein